MTVRTEPVIWATVLCASALGFACGGSPAGPSIAPPVTTLDAVISTAVTVDGAAITAVSHQGAPPAAGAGPVVSAATSSRAAAGNFNLITIDSGSPFQVIYISVGNVAPKSGLFAVFTALGQLLEKPLSAANDPANYLEITLPAPTTSAEVGVSYDGTLLQTASSFELRVQAAASGGPAGPIASAAKVVTESKVEMVGVVYQRLALNPVNPRGPGVLVDPVQGAVVSTSLDSRTTLTDKNGAFDLETDTVSTVGRCFVLTITAAGSPVYSTDGWGGNKMTGPVTFTLSPPSPTNVQGCR